VKRENDLKHPDWMIQNKDKRKKKQHTGLTQV
jgi:hypothetical protein